MSGSLTPCLWATRLDLSTDTVGELAADASLGKNLNEVPRKAEMPDISRRAPQQRVISPPL